MKLIYMIFDIYQSSSRSASEKIFIKLSTCACSTTERSLEFFAKILIISEDSP